jgi:pimeloyl-ACP methyl ester carboxylesterase
VLILLSIYAVWCVVLYLVQDRMMFPRDLLGKPTPEAIIPPTVERVWVEAGDGVRVEGWFLKCEEGGRRPAVIYWHGNAELIDECIGTANLWRQRGYHVLLCEFRGYGRSGGSPGERGLVEDATRFYDRLGARSDVDNTKIIAHGRSLGAGVAAQLAVREPVAGLVLESAFRSAASFSWRLGAPPVLVKSPFRTDRALSGFARPLIILHSAEDEIIPVSHGRALHALVPGSTYIELRGGHNSGMSGQAEFWEGIDGWLAGVGLPHGVRGGE